jgi:hypothetical protein
MRRLIAALALATLLAVPLSAGPARADCPVPEALALTDLALPAAKAAAKAGALTILVLGGAPMAGRAADDPAATLPARLQADLAALLPGVRVSVVNAAQPGAMAADAVPRIGRLLSESGARLVIWATGSREAALGKELGPFVAQVEAGIDAVRAAGADLILVDMQYAPSLARIMNVAPYREALTGVAAKNAVALLPRYALMLRWHDDGVLDLDVRDPDARKIMTRRLFACLAAALAAPIAASVR